MEAHNRNHTPYVEGGRRQAIRTTDDVECVRRVAANPAAVWLLAEAEDEIIGTLLGAFDGWRGNLYRLVVHPNRRHEGIGRQLVRRVERVFADWGVRRITVLIEVDRPWAMDHCADVRPGHNMPLHLTVPGPAHACPSRAALSLAHACRR